METEIIPADNNNSITIDDSKSKAERVFDLLDASEQTRAYYKRRIGLFIDFIKGTSLNRNSFLDFKRYLANRTDIAVVTKNAYLTTARIFLKELNRIGQISSDITQNIKSFKQSRKHKKDGLNEEEIERLTEKVRSLPYTPENARNKALLSLLTLQGLRQIEIVRLDVKDIDLAGQTAFIQGKGRDDKEMIYLHPETVRVLKEYFRSSHITDGPVFASRSNNCRNKRLGTRSIRRIITGLLKELDIEKTTHGFRHTFTTILIKKYKGDLLEVARYTRHKSLEMLQVYNDNIKQKADLPRFYETFEKVKF